MACREKQDDTQSNKRSRIDVLQKGRQLELPVPRAFAQNCISSDIPSLKFALVPQSLTCRTRIADDCTHPMLLALLPRALAGFHACRALSTSNEDPAAASRPWDKNR